MKSNAEILKEIYALAKASLPESGEMGYTMPDGKHHIYIYADQETHWDDRPADLFYVVEPNRVVSGAHDPMGDTYLTETRDLSEVLIGCQWCLDVFAADREVQRVSSEPELPDELIVRMAHEAGWLESEGKIELQSWEDLQVAIRDAISEYYDNPSERNPFSVEEALQKILMQRFPSEPENHNHKEIHILTMTSETDAGIYADVTLHSSMKDAMAHAEALRQEDTYDETRCNFDVSTQIIDVSCFKEVSQEKANAFMLSHQPQRHLTGPSSLDALVRNAQAKAAAQMLPGHKAEPQR